MTFAPNDFAISTVRSVEPVSTTMISSTASRAAARLRGSISSSSRTIMQRLRVRPSAGRAADEQRSARLARAFRATEIVAGTGTWRPLRRRASSILRLSRRWGSVGLRRRAALKRFSAAVHEPSS
jgi:hypothetical protein